MVSDAALEALPYLLVIEELDMVPTAEELSKGIDCLTSWKAPGKDSFPSEVLKSGNAALLWYFHELLCLFGEKGHVPHDMHGANIFTLHKNKSDHCIMASCFKA